MNPLCFFLVHSIVTCNLFLMLPSAKSTDSHKNHQSILCTASLWLTMTGTRTQVAETATERLEAQSRISLAGKRLSSNIFRKTPPTAPVAPTNAILQESTFASKIEGMGSRVWGVRKAASSTPVHSMLARFAAQFHRTKHASEIVAVRPAAEKTSVCDQIASCSFP